MRDPNGRLDLVDVLAAGAAGSKSVDAEILVVDRDFDVFFQFGIYEDRGEGGVPPLVRVEGGNADQTMDAGFGLQVAVSIGARHGEGGALDAGFVARLVVQRLHLVVFRFRPAHVHA